MDYIWNVYKSIVESDGYINNTKVLVTFSDENDDGIPDNPDIFDVIVNYQTNNTISRNKLVFFEELTGVENFSSHAPLDSALVVTDYSTLDDIRKNVLLYDVDQLFYATDENIFYTLTDAEKQTFTVHASNEYITYPGRQMLYFQYRHNSPNYRRIDPSPSNLIDIFLLTKAYEEDYRAWVQDKTGTVSKPTQPTSEELRLQYFELENYKGISDSLVYNPAKFKPIFGGKAEASLQATFKVIKNINVNVSDNDIKSSVIDAINTYFDIDNWDFGETFYFSELSAYLHSSLAPNIASIIITPANNASGNSQFGSLYQINAEPDEIIISAATVDNIEIISDITAEQLK
jgi:hypothetical protein